MKFLSSQLHSFDNFGPPEFSQVSSYHRKGVQPAEPHTGYIFFFVNTNSFHEKFNFKHNLEET